MDPLNGLPASAPTPLTAAQKTALQKLHDAATRLEGVFIGMLYKEMQKTIPKDGIFGKQSNAESMWQDMLADKQADAAAKTGSFGIAKMVESQLRSQVLASASAVPVVPPVVPTVPSALGSPSLTLESEERP